MDSATTFNFLLEECRQFNCQVCDSITLSFLTHDLRHLCLSFVGASLSEPDISELTV